MDKINESTSITESTKDEELVGNSNKTKPDETYDQLFTYDDWHIGCKIRATAHIWSNESLLRTNKAVGLISVILTALSGSSIFAGINLDEGLPTDINFLYIIALALSLAIATLTAIQTFLKLPERAQVHHQTFVEYIDLCNDIEFYLNEYIEVHRDMAILNENMLKINERMNKVETGRPNITEKIYSKAKKHIEDLKIRPYSLLLRQREYLENKKIKTVPIKTATTETTSTST